jgi:hypothetical protein
VGCSGRSDELSWAPASDLGGEVNDDDLVNARLAQQLIPALQ